MDFNKARNLIIDILTNKLPDNLWYHGIHHTFDVLESSITIAESEIDATEEELTMLKTAVLLHDSGFSIDATRHEECGCEIAKEILPNCGYSEPQIEAICGMIMATKIPQNPQNDLEKIICDADLDYLGREDFFEIGDTLYKELEAGGKIGDFQQWDKLQISFLTNHKYHTKFGQTYRESKKQENLQKVILRSNNQSP